MPKTLSRFASLTFHHSHRITLEVFRVAAISDRGCTGQGPMGAPEGTEQLAFASAHKQILKRLEDE